MYTKKELIWAKYPSVAYLEGRLKYGVVSKQYQAKHLALSLTAKAVNSSG